MILGGLGKNVYVKVPIVFSNGKSTKEVIKKLIKENIQLNITAIFTLDQIKNILNEIQNTNTILSIFVGRIFDLGLMVKKLLKK